MIDRGTERALVGAVIAEPARHLAEVASLTIGDFGDPQARLVYQAIRNVQAAGLEITPATVRAEIERDSGHRDHRWLDVVLECASGKPQQQVAGWARTVARMAKRRAAMLAAGEEAERAQHEHEAAAQHEHAAAAMGALADMPPPDVAEIRELPRRVHVSDLLEAELLDFEAERARATDCEPPDDDDDDDDEHPNAPGAPGPGPGRGKRSIATLLVDLARRASELWRSTTGDLYATITVNAHREHVRISSREHRRWLARLGLVQLGRAIGAGALGDACGALEGIARYDSETHPVHIRICGTDERVYIDLCDERWRAVEIDRHGWRVVDRPPVRFERRAAMAPLPVPIAGGSLDEIRDHVRITDDSWPLVLGWLVGALSPSGPYPVLVFRGQHGAGKSYGARRVRSLIDPSIAPIRSEPREPRDLVISARGSHVIALDNLSTVPPWLSDGLCRLATGGGYAARALYTDADEIVIDVQRPAILTGITDVVTAPDLLDRALLVELEAIAPEDRETERRLDARWAGAQPRLLGALYYAVSMALARRDVLELPRLPRLADWATWATAAEPALGLPDGAVIGALDGQAEEATEIAIDASIIARPLVAWIRERIDPVWVGTAEELLNLLTDRAAVATARDKRWPTTARGLVGQLARIAPALAAIGVCVERLARGSGGVRNGRGWRVERLGVGP